MKKCLNIKISNPIKSNNYCCNLYSKFNFRYYNKSYSEYYLINNTYKKNIYGIITKYLSNKISFDIQNSQQNISPESSNNNSNSNKKISKMSEGVKRLLEEENLENEINNTNNTDTSDGSPKISRNEYNKDTYNKYNSNNKDSSNRNNEFDDIVLNTENISDICLAFTTIKQYQQFFIAKYKSLVYDTPLLLLFYDYYITFLNAQIQNNSLSISEKIQLEEDSKSKAIKSNFLSNIKVKSDIDYKTAYLYYEEDVIERTDLINCSNANIREILDIRNDIIIKTISIMMNYKITETNLDPFLLISFIESTTKAFHYNAFQDTYDDENISKYDDITEIDKFNLDNISNSGNKDISGNSNNDSSLLNVINNFSSSLNIKDKLLNAAGLKDKNNKHVKTKKNKQRIKTKNIYNQIMLKFQYLILRTHFLKNIEYKYFPIILKAFENFFKEDSQTTVDPEEVFEKLEYEILLYLNDRHNVYLSEYDSINSSNINNNSNSINNSNSNKKHNNLVKLTSFKDFLLQQNNTSLLFLFKDNIIESFILIAKNLEGSLEFYEAIIYMLHANINLIFTKSFDVNASKSIPEELSDLSININGSNDVNSINNPIISEYYNANIYDVSEVETKNNTSKRITVINKNLFIEIYYCLVLVSDNVCSNSKVINSLLNKMEDILNEHSKKVYYYLSELVISDEDEFNDYSERIMNKNKFPLLLYNKEVTVDMLKWALNKREKFLLENKFASM